MMAPDRGTEHDLRRILQRIDGRGYKAYGELEGRYDFGSYLLGVEHVQGDPFAPPSLISLSLTHQQAGFSSDLYASRVRQIAFGDFLVRRFAEVARRICKGDRGIGGSGRMVIDRGGQEVLERTAVRVDDRGIELRCFVGLPAAGRTILSREAEAILFEEIPEIVQATLVFGQYDQQGREAIKRHVEVVEDQEAIRAQLDRLGLIAFVANGAILPRRSGVDDRPALHCGERLSETMASRGQTQPVIPFASPSTLEVELTTPNRGTMRGMGLPAGVTLIVGGGFHGKSTLLKAMERGVYNHIPGDGREYVVSLAETVKIKAEEGRSVRQVDISPFINHLPFGRDTVCFSTDNASGSTSQAANIMEALEVGARVLLIDEDTSATNFMIRDGRMQRLVAKGKEPITPFVDKVRQLYQEHGVSSVLVMGGCGDYLDVADRVIMMDAFSPRDVTAEARQVVAAYPRGRQSEGGTGFGQISPRLLRPEGFDSSRGRREVKIDAKGPRLLCYGRTNIELGHVEQLVDQSQARTIGHLIHYAVERYAHGREALAEVLRQAMADLEAGGLDLLSPFKMGNLAKPRSFEVAAAINRMRTLQVRGADHLRGAA